MIKKKTLKFLLLFGFTLVGIAALLVLSACKSNDTSCFKLPADFPEQMEKITYNGNIYGAAKVITFRICPAFRPNPPEVRDRRTGSEITVEPIGEPPGEVLERKGQTYGFNMEAVCNELWAETPNSRDFGDELESYIGEASTSSNSYHAYSLNGIDENQAIAIEIMLTTDSSTKIDNCPWCALCYLEYVRQ